MDTLKNALSEPVDHEIVRRLPNSYLLTSKREDLERALGGAKLNAAGFEYEAHNTL